MLVIMWDDHFGMVAMYNDGDERTPISVACNQAASWWDIWKQKGDSNDVALLTAQQENIWSPRITARSEIMLSCCSGAAERRKPPVLAPENTDKKNQRDNSAYKNI